MGGQFRCFPLTSRCSPARTLVGATWVWRWPRQFLYFGSAVSILK